MDKKTKRKIRAIPGLLTLALMMMVGFSVSVNAASSKLNKKNTMLTVRKMIKVKVKDLSFLRRKPLPTESVGDECAYFLRTYFLFGRSIPCC